jgi:dTDP-4-dehydrorhamnose reductase
MKIDKSTRVYISGCGGMLGEAVYEYFSTRSTVHASDIDVNAEWLTYADVRDYAQMEKEISAFKPDLIINLAALTDLEYCEQNPEHTWLTNALGAENIALLSKKLNVPHVYISTAGIFAGEKEFFNDFDEPNPLSLYAKAKYYGEEYVKKYLEKYFVFRAGWMMGGGIKKDKKFINKIYKQIKAGKKEIFVVNDKLGTPTYTNSFARAIFKVVETDLYGLYNQVCEGDCSRYDVALEFIRLLGLENIIKISKVSSDYFKNEYFAPRPYSEKLINLKLKARNIDFMPHWKDALKEYSQVFKKDLDNTR